MRAACVLVLLVLVAVAVSVHGESLDDTKKPPPCKKAKLQAPLPIELRYPVLVKDYHPVDGAIDPNAISEKEADSTARVIIREHLAWERENPPPPKQLNMQELKDLGEKLDEHTLAIQRGGKAFRQLAKFVDDDDRAYKEFEAKKIADAKAKVLKAQAEAASKIKAAAEFARIQKLRQAILAKKAAAAAAAAAKAAPKLIQLSETVEDELDLDDEQEMEDEQEQEQETDDQEE